MNRGGGPDNRGMVRRCPGVVLWLVVFALAAAAMPCAAGDGALRSRRLIHLFDFEERDQGNSEAMPQHWYAIGRLPRTDDANFVRVPMHEQQVRRSGFGPHSRVEFDRLHRVSGGHSFVLGLNGGSAGAFLEAGAIPAIPQSDYLITANLRTQPLRYARAQIVAYFVDVRGEVIPGSEVAAPAIQTDGQWREVTLRLLGDFPDAAYIGMDLVLRQPEAADNSPLGRHEVVYQEVAGQAWFDDIGVWQLPHVEVGTASAVNILRQQRSPELTMEVRDLTGQAMTASAVVYDHTMRAVDRQDHAVGRGASPSWRWTPKLPRHGWYLIDMQVREKRAPDASGPPAPIARTLGAVLWLPPESRLAVQDAGHFALDAEGVAVAERALLPQVLAGTGLDAAVVSAWQPDTNALNIEAQQAELDELLSTLAGQGRMVTLSLSPVPRDISRVLDIDPQNPAGLFKHPRDMWMPYLAPVLMRQGQVVRRWQVGSAAQPQLFYHGDVPELAATMDAAFRDLAPDPTLVLPWSLNHARLPGLSTQMQFVLDVPPIVQAARIGEHLAEWQTPSADAAPGQPAPPRSQAWLHLREPPADAMSHQQRVIDLALRMLHGWEAGAAGMTLHQPWTAAPTRHPQVLPDPLLGVFASIAHRLAGRRVIGRMRVHQGVECMILNGPAGGALVAWRTDAHHRDAHLKMFLGPDPVAIDVWGNRTPLPVEDNRHVLQLTDTPIFIEGIDPALAMFRATFTLDQPFIESTQVRHQRVVRLSNPWPRTISGHFTVTDPPDWFVNPRRQFFSLAAGAASEFPVDLAFPVSELAGEKKLIARFDFTADQRYVVDLTTDLELGLRHVNFDATLTLTTDPATGKADAVITMLITNTGPDRQALYAFANLVGYPRQERIVSDLQSGQSIVRRFTFPDAAAALQTANVRVGLRETIGPAVLNKSLQVEPQ